MLRNHPGEVHLLSHACVAIGNLAANYRPNQDLLGVAGGIEAVVDELRLHVASSSVCYTASAALHSALDGHPSNSAKFVECGGLALFEDIVVEHDDAKINATVEKMMSALSLADPRHRQLSWSIFDPIEQRPADWDKLSAASTAAAPVADTQVAAAGAELGKLASKWFGLGGPKRPKGAVRTAIRQLLQSR